MPNPFPNNASRGGGNDLPALEMDRTMHGVEVRRTSYALWERIDRYLAIKARVLAVVSGWQKEKTK